MAIYKPNYRADFVHRCAKAAIHTDTSQYRDFGTLLKN
jgi:hypothetical protein